MRGDGARIPERGAHAWLRDPTSSDVAADLDKHEAVCAERWGQILSRMARMETIVVSAAGALLLGMLGIIMTMLIKGIHQ